MIDRKACTELRQTDYTGDWHSPQDDQVGVHHTRQADQTGGCQKPQTDCTEFQLGHTVMCHSSEAEAAVLSGSFQADRFGLCRMYHTGQHSHTHLGCSVARTECWCKEQTDLPDCCCKEQTGCTHCCCKGQTGYTDCCCKELTDCNGMYHTLQAGSMWMLLENKLLQLQHHSHLGSCCCSSCLGKEIAAAAVSLACSGLGAAKGVALWPCLKPCVQRRLPVS